MASSFVGVPAVRGQMGLLLLVVLLAATPVAGGAVAVAVQGRSQSHGPIYSELQVVNGLTNHPSRWVGRTIRVRGVVSGLLCVPGCPLGPGRPSLAAVLRGEWLPLLVDTSDTEGIGPSALPLLLKPRSPLLTTLGQLPVLGSLLPGQRLAWRATAVYRIRLQARPCIVGVYYCYAGVLDDAIPSVK